MAATDSDDNSVENFDIENITTTRRSINDYEYKSEHSPGSRSQTRSKSVSQDTTDDVDAASKAFQYWKSLQNDELYLEFSSHNYDPGDYLQKTVSERKEKNNLKSNDDDDDDDIGNRNSAIPSATDSTIALNKLRESLCFIDGYIRNEMIAKNSELLSQSDDIQKLESNLHVVSEKVSILNNYVYRIKSGIIDPFYEYKRKTLQLNNIQYCESLLQNVLKCKKKLNSLQAIFNAKQQKKDSIIKAAMIVSELRNMIYYNDNNNNDKNNSNSNNNKSINTLQMDLSGITILESKKSYVDGVFQRVWYLYLF